MSALLEVDGINSYYGDSHILFDVSLRVERERGRGAARPQRRRQEHDAEKPDRRRCARAPGRITLDGDADRTACRRTRSPRSGLQLVPEERRIFGSLNVEENLVLAGLTAQVALAARPGLGDLSAPASERRRSRGTDLSGGEQQMLAIARALVRDPKIILLDEPFEGLAPIIVRDLLATCRSLAEAGQTIVVVEQNISAAMTLADRVYILNNGHVVEELTAQAVREQPEMLHRHLGV